MTLKLIRREFRADGIFSQLEDMNGKVIAQTLEHSYDLKPKLYDGTFTCVRGIHQLHGGVKFQTFEITGVSGHTGLLFHVGNWNENSDGCVLLGGGVAQSTKGQMITASTTTFVEFMTLLQGLDSFDLIVQD